MVSPQLSGAVALGISSIAATLGLIPSFATFLIRKGLTGKDLCKKGLPGSDRPIPEGVGIIPATLFLVCVTILQCWISVDELIRYQSALLSICFMVFLGFADDALDLPWRYKFLLPTIATLPLLCAYDGSTSIVIPPPLSSRLPEWFLSERFVMGKNGFLLIDLGVIYFLYMGLLAVFCTNAINIYAGINGLEAGQTVVIALALLYLSIQGILVDGIGTSNYLFSASILLPFIGTTLGLLYKNWYPARVFVGDTFCYFAGMTFAVVGIHGHLSKTLLLMFLPQVVNFILSVPQLFKLVPCPRHRLPRFCLKTGLLEPSTTECPWLARLLPILVPHGAPPNHTMNLTLINAALMVCGPLREDTLCIILLLIQASTCALGVTIHGRLVRWGE